MYVCMYVSSIAPNTVQRNNEHKEERSDDKKREVVEDREWKDGRCHLVSPRPPSVHYSVVGEKRRPGSRVSVGMVFQRLLVKGRHARVACSPSSAVPGVDPGRRTFAWTSLLKQGLAILWSNRHTHRGKRGTGPLAEISAGSRVPDGEHDRARRYMRPASPPISSGRI